MKVLIVVSGPYTDFQNELRAKQLGAGAVEEFPDWYAQSLIASGLAEEEPVFQRVLEAVAGPDVAAVLNDPSPTVDPGPAEEGMAGDEVDPPASKRRKRQE